MNTFSTVLLSSCISLASSVAFAQDAMKTPDGMAKEGMMKGDAMTMQQCKDHIAMSKKDGMKKDGAMMKKDDAMMMKDTMCAGMMKKDGMTKDDSTMMKKEDPMKR